MLLELECFYGSEAEQYSFYRIPKVLLTDQRYKNVSMKAKVLYGLMLGCGKDKAVRLFKELDKSSGTGYKDYSNLLQFEAGNGHHRQGNQGTGRVYAGFHPAEH